MTHEKACASGSNNVLPADNALYATRIFRRVFAQAPEYIDYIRGIFLLHQPTRAALLHPVSDSTIIEGNYGYPAGPELCECVTIGFRPYRKDAANMGPDLADSICELFSGIYAMRNYVGRKRDIYAHISKNVDFQIFL